MKKTLIAILFLLNSFAITNCQFEPLVSVEKCQIHFHMTLERLQTKDFCKDLIQQLWNAYKIAHQIDLYQALSFNYYQEKIPSNSYEFYSLLSSLIQQNPACMPDNQIEGWFSQKIIPAFYKEISND